MHKVGRSPVACVSLALALASSSSLGAPVGSNVTAETPASSIEIALLPTFCWEQYRVPGIQGDEFKMRNCGPGINHYCPGLVGYNRGRSAPSKPRALYFLKGADGAIAYTERAIADYPNCSIREHVAATRAELNRLLRMYGAKPEGAR
jgi:hypothetical protein